MSLVVAVPFGVASAVVYGASIVVQHRAAQKHAGVGGTESVTGLWQTVRSPAWLLAILGDFVGFVLQIVALSTGQVVVIQPLVVLMLPVSLFVSATLGWHRPRPGDYLGVVSVVGGLALFLCLIGNPAAGHVPRPRYLCIAIVAVLLAGAALCVVVTGRNAVVRGAMYGAVAGGYFGTLAVLVDAASQRASDHGLHGLLLTARGLIPLAGIALLGVAGMALTQVSFQVGSLAATLPTNLATDPLTAVVLGAVLLHEHIPHSAWHATAYAGCLVAVVVGAIRLARAEAEAEAEADAREGERLHQ